MFPKRIRSSPVRNEFVILDGGVNENVSSLELKGGELLSALNYELLEGSSGGYRSIAGYERYDGQTKPSSVVATEEDHTDRDSARAAIGEVPGEGWVLACWVYMGEVYAFRNKTGGATAGMYMATSSGWSEIDTSSDPLSPSGSYNFVNYNFSATSGGLTMYWVDGEDKARSYDGTTVTTIDNSGMDPNDTPINIIAHNNRLFLAYDGGSLQYSTLGDPTDWTTSAGEIGVGRNITGLGAGVGNALIVFCDHSIKILNGYTPDDWTLDTHSTSSGAFLKTPKRMLGTFFFMDDRGVTTLGAVQEYGDFAANSISQNIKRTLLANKDLITCATVIRPLNQYRLFFEDGAAIIFSFLNTKLRGITVAEYPIPILTVAEGADTNDDDVVFFTSSDGYVYQMNIGTSFDGDEIETSLKTAYYGYKSPRNWKRFLRTTLEIASADAMDFNIKYNFDYGSFLISKATTDIISVLGSGSRYGEGIWGVARYSGAEATNRIYYDTLGVGTNMSIEVSTLEAYTGQHTLQNFITDFTLLGRQM